jgi:hypothetical protein
MALSGYTQPPLQALSRLALIKKCCSTRKCKHQFVCLFVLPVWIHAAPFFPCLFVCLFIILGTRSPLSKFPLLFVYLGAHIGYFIFMLLGYMQPHWSSSVGVVAPDCVLVSLPGLERVCQFSRSLKILYLAVILVWFALSY